MCVGVKGHLTQSYRKPAVLRVRGGPSLDQQAAVKGLGFRGSHQTDEYWGSSVAGPGSEVTYPHHKRGVRLVGCWPEAFWF